MGTTTGLTLFQRLSQDLGDYISFATTTPIAATKLVVSTTLNEHDWGQNGSFNNWYILIDGVTNAEVVRRLGSTAYVSSSGTLYVYGANLQVEAANKTCYLTKYSFTDYLRAINKAARTVCPNLHQKVNNRQLITGNLMPCFNWLTTATLAHYTSPAGTLLKIATAGSTLNGKTSAKVTGSGANDKLELDSNNYPPLLDCMGQAIEVRVWVQAEVANDADITIIETENDGVTTNTNTSTTTCAAGQWTLLELDRTLDSDLTRIQIQLRVNTTTKYAIWGEPRLTGIPVYEYILPDDFDDGVVSQVRMQSSSLADDPCDDMNPRFGGTTIYPRVISRYFLDGGTEYNFLSIGNDYVDNYRLELVGYAPLSNALTGLTSTIEIDGKEVELLLPKAKAELAKIIKGTPSSQDTAVFTQMQYEGELEYERLKRTLGMARPTIKMNIRGAR